MDPFVRDPFDVFDPFVMDPFYHPQRSAMSRSINNSLNSMANIMQSLNDATNLVLGSNPKSKRREIVESPDKYEIFINVPEGMETKDITLELVRNDEVLHLSGVHKAEKDNIVSESRINRMFTLGKNADTSKISAKLSGGVVAVTVPKIEVDKVKESRRIEISEEKVSNADDKADTDDATVKAKNTEDAQDTVEEREGTSSNVEEEGEVNKSSETEDWEKVQSDDEELEITED
jgi:HSP20 family molecular chaperone IbpA